MNNYNGISNYSKQSPSKMEKKEPNHSGWDTYQKNSWTNTQNDDNKIEYDDNVILRKNQKSDKKETPVSEKTEEQPIQMFPDKENKVKHPKV